MMRCGKVGVMSEARAGYWMPTYTGRQVWPLDLRAEDIDIRDIAHHLAGICHFLGACSGHITVAQHSVVVSRLCPPALALYGLLHDSAEAYLGDVPRPMKRLRQMAWYRRAEARALGVILPSFGLKARLPRRLHGADNAALRAEVEQLLPPHPAWSAWWDEHPEDGIAGAAPVGVIGHVLTPVQAEMAFLLRYEAVTGRVTA